MRGVSQSIVDAERGDCTRAVMATLFRRSLEEMPLFAPVQGQGFEVRRFFVEQGFEDPICFRSKGDLNLFRRVAQIDGGVDGYYYATVKSRTFEGRLHAVVVDRDLQVVWDPNPNGMACHCTPEEILSIWTLGAHWHINIDGQIVEADRPWLRGEE